MNRILASIMAVGVIAAGSSALAAEGEYYNGAKKPQASSSIDRTLTGSIDNQNAKPKTSRDNRVIFDGQGSYYEGVQRPN